MVDFRPFDHENDEQPTFGTFGWAVSLFLEPSLGSRSVSFRSFLTDGVYGRRPTAVGLTRPSRRCSASRWCRRCCLASPGLSSPGGTMASPGFGRSVNPISTRGVEDYDHQITMEPPDFQTFLRPFSPPCTSTTRSSSPTLQQSLSTLGGCSRCLARPSC